MSKIILITGASTGIGAAIATYLAEKNQIIVHYNSSKKAAEQVAETINKKGGTAHLVQADLSTESGCEELANFVKNKWGKLDVLINNAGGMIKSHSSQEITWDFMEKLFKLNTFSAMYLSSLCVPLLRQGLEACVINITSVVIRHGGTAAPIYAASKGALDVFTRNLARELAPNIRVNAIAPGLIKTPFHDGLTSDERMQEVAAITPLKKLGASEHIAKIAAMLIDNDFMTGETVDVNGGLYMR